MSSNNIRKYRNPLPFVSVAAWILLAVIVCIAGSSYVYIRDQHRAKEGEIKDLAIAAREVEDEITNMQLRILGVTDRKWLAERLSEWGSNLQPIEFGVVEVIDPNLEEDMAMADPDRETVGKP